MFKLNVDLGERSYPIFIGESLLGKIEYLKPYIAGRQVAIVTNETVAPIYLKKVERALDGYDLAVEVLPDGEFWKNLATVERIFDRLLKARFTRKATLIALGGGVVGDMVGFAAACYQRGIGFIQVPTTLLAQVDSSVGGKTGVNHPQGKNMIGAFHQPNAVVIDIGTLSTLPNREFSAGMAEVIKYGLICDKSFYFWLRGNMRALLNRDSETLGHAIYQSCQHKARVVMEDERESGVRAILNFGHTFGHAIETCLGYSRWLHGEAVAVGMVMAANLSFRLGMIGKDDVDDLTDLLKQFWLPVIPPSEMTPDRFMELMAVDKKVLDGRMRLILLRCIGEGIVANNVDEVTLLDCLSEFCSFN
ncbi:MAG: 3-dehydroquinate synthase [Candidatus Endonucleobacter bathymodioli]|uniref:3-dehydroquinate synthase n=1 Tax=Candidatus Endonucleibacter bathymodioli TaxID=539814 RepID=A0AA90SCN0_9GAMM|nr:3-dehydroquinate synthase [Candidatus Endonucleobacter bathymodioli]